MKSKIYIVFLLLTGLFWGLGSHLMAGTHENDNVTSLELPQTAVTQTTYDIIGTQHVFVYPENAETLSPFEAEEDESYFLTKILKSVQITILNFLGEPSIFTPKVHQGVMNGHLQERASAFLFLVFQSFRL